LDLSFGETFLIRKQGNQTNAGSKVNATVGMKAPMNAVITSDRATEWTKRLMAAANEPGVSLTGSAMFC
jgi:hypothetical protein